MRCCVAATHMNRKLGVILVQMRNLLDAVLAYGNDNNPWGSYEFSRGSISH